ncbi:unnamed protein product [Cylicostephanus goldi]|uniref:Ion transport domain-containing protein n=1 Tax=Cylicostephanus goldi TaxID=71465 RepID=A0A3P7N2C7_CYLGO|nr:unnamed protein product [Cylicostephanus goldi]
MFAERYIQFCRQGFANHFIFWWRWFDCVLIGIFCLALHLWLTGVLMPMESDLQELNRIHWPAWDYFVIYDIYICTGCILGIWRIFYFFQLIKGIGGSVISVGCCIGAIYNYLVVMGVIVISFAVGINMIVQPYLHSVVYKPDNTKMSMGDEFRSIFQTTRRLYWAIYGFLDPSAYTVINGNAGPELTPVEHYVTAFATEVNHHLDVVVNHFNAQE